MPHTITVRLEASAFGQQYTDDQSVTADMGTPHAPSVPAAKTGTLTTRTDANTGTLTMESGHGIATADKIDIYWDGGSRANVTVGTVSGTSVPIDLGSGTDLPAVTTEVTAMVANIENVTAAGDDLVAFGFKSNDTAATFTVTEAGGTVLLTIILEENSSYIWNNNSGITNPLAGADIGAILSSHAGSEAAQTMHGFLAYN